MQKSGSWIFGIQPAEFLKLGTILVTARFFALRQKQAKNKIYIYS
jgi:cell division protein FtsW